MSSDAEIEDFVHQELAKVLPPSTCELDVNCHEVKLGGGKGIALFHPKFYNSTLEAKGITPLNVHCSMSSKLCKDRFFVEMEINENDVPAFNILFGVGNKHARSYVRGAVLPEGEFHEGWSLSYQGLFWLSGLYFDHTSPVVRKGSYTFGLYYSHGHISYFIDSVIIHTGWLSVKNPPIFPIISSVSTRPRTCYKTNRREIPSLQEFCRALILRRLSCESQIYQLDVTQPVERFLIKGLYEAPRLRERSPDEGYPWF